MIGRGVAGTPSIAGLDHLGTFYSFDALAVFCSAALMFRVCNALCAPLMQRGVFNMVQAVQYSL